MLTIVNAFIYRSKDRNKKTESAASVFFDSNSLIDHFSRESLYTVHFIHHTLQYTTLTHYTIYSVKYTLQNPIHHTLQLVGGLVT